MKNETNRVTFDNLPHYVMELGRKIEELTGKLDSLTGSKKSNPEWMDVEMLREYLPDHPKRPTVYQWSSLNKIPHNKIGKKLYFNKLEIDEWLKSGRKKTVSEIEGSVTDYLTN